jgi:hypothetical protein
LSSGYIKTEKQEKDFKEMTGEDSELFLNTAQMSVVGEDLDGFGAAVYHWWVAHLAGYCESIIMFLPDGKFCAAVIDEDNNKIKVYTNANYISKTPETIQAWSGDFPGLTAEFINRCVR